jgi:hypothetical protein
LNRSRFWCFQYFSKTMQILRRLETQKVAEFHSLSNVCNIWIRFTNWIEILFCAHKDRFLYFQLNLEYVESAESLNTKCYGLSVYFQLQIICTIRTDCWETRSKTSTSKQMGSSKKFWQEVHCC